MGRALPHPGGAREMPVVDPGDHEDVRAGLHERRGQ